MAIEPGEQLPEGMFISASSPSHSVRVAPFKEREVLIVSGEGHPVGEPGEQGASAELAAARAVGERPARRRAGALPLVDAGPSTRSTGFRSSARSTRRARIFTATGFGGWGMTGGTAAAMLLRDLVEEIENPWAELYNPGRFELKAVPALVRKGAHDAKRRR